MYLASSEQSRGRVQDVRNLNEWFRNLNEWFRNLNKWFENLNEWFRNSAQLGTR